MTIETSQLPASVLTKNQKKIFNKSITYYGKPATIKAEVRYDDRCGNGHNSFSITGEIWLVGKRSDCETCGCIHDDIAKHFPELAPFIKWHLTSSDGPMHYIANTVYHASESESKARELNHARSSAVWPDATDEDLTAPGLEQRLADRLPALMAEFRAAVESLDFTY